MNKKFLATTLMAATMFGASFTATTADAASLNKEVKSENAHQYIQMIKGDITIIPFSYIEHIKNKDA